MDYMQQSWSWSAVGTGSLVVQDRMSGLKLPCINVDGERTNGMTKTTVS